MDPSYGHLRSFVGSLKRDLLYTKAKMEKYQVDFNLKADCLVVTRENGSVCTITGAEINRYLARTRNEISYMNRLHGQIRKPNGSAKWLEPIVDKFCAHLHACTCFPQNTNTEANQC